MPHRLGEDRPNAKFTNAQVIEIRRRSAAREATYIELANEYGVALSVMGNILTRRTWRHLP